MNEQVEHRTIELDLVRASRLEQFKTEQGVARMLMPYWIELGEGDMMFRFIHAKTDKLELETQIAHGVVWVQEKYAEVKGER